MPEQSAIAAGILDAATDRRHAQGARARQRPDLFSRAMPPQIELSGQLVELKFRGLERLTPAAYRADRAGSDRLE